VYQRRTCARVRGETEACDLKTRDETKGEVSCASAKNKKKLVRTSDRVESDEADATASKHGWSFYVETMSASA